MFTYWNLPHFPTSPQHVTVRYEPPANALMQAWFSAYTTFWSEMARQTAQSYMPQMCKPAQQTIDPWQSWWEMMPQATTPSKQATTPANPWLAWNPWLH